MFVEHLFSVDITLTLREECKLRIFENRIEANIWTQEVWEWGVAKAPQRGTSLYLSSDIVRVIKCRRLRWAGRVAKWKKAEVFSKC